MTWWRSWRLRVAFAIELGSLLAILCIPAVWAVRYAPVVDAPE